MGPQASSNPKPYPSNLQASTVDHKVWHEYASSVTYRLSICPLRTMSYGYGDTKPEDVDQMMGVTHFLAMRHQGFPCFVWVCGRRAYPIGGDDGSWGSSFRMH